MCVVTILALIVCYEQLKTTRTDERAWLRIDLAYQTKDLTSAIVVAQDQPLSAHLSVANFGKTVAKAIYVDACMEMLDNTQPIQAKWMSKCYQRPHYRVETGLLFPGSGINDTQMQRVSQNLAPTPPTQVQFEQFTAGKGYVIVFGRVHYIDVFKQERWTQFCFPVTRGNLSESARQCVNFASEGQGDYDHNYERAQ